MAGQRITAQDIADQLDISRNATNSRMAKGLTADDIITIARGLGINPVTALEELGHVGVGEIFDYLDDDGKRLVTATPSDLVYYLAQDLLSADQKLALVRGVMGLPNQTPIDEPSHLQAVADSSPDEDALRAQQEGNDFE